MTQRTGDETTGSVDEAAMELAVNVLGVREDGAWCAIALEMSLRGYGETFREAVDELTKAMEAQISFAVQHDNLDQIFVPAEPHYFRLYADMRRDALKRMVTNRSPSGFSDYRVGDIPLPMLRPGEFSSIGSART